MPQTRLPSLFEAAQTIANLPEVLPLVAVGFAGIDLSPFFADKRNLALGGWDGVVLLVYASEGVYEGHYLFRPSTPGRRVFQTCRMALATAFTIYNATLIVGHVPAGNRRARAITCALGFARRGTSVSSTGRSCVDYSLERAQWAISSAASLAA